MTQMRNTLFHIVEIKISEIGRDNFGKKYKGWGGGRCRKEGLFECLLMEWNGSQGLQ